MILLSVTTVVKVVKCIMIVLIGLVVTGALVFIYFRKFRSTSRKVVEEDIDYSDLDRHDTRDFVQFEDIKDNMIKLSDREFVAGILCRGIDFWSLPAAEKLAIKRGYKSFVGMIQEPITYRQLSKAMDLTPHIDQYKKRAEEVADLITSLSIDFEELKMEAASIRATGDYEGLNMILDEMDRLKRRIEVENAKLKHLNEQIYVQEVYNANMTQIDREETYMFSYTYYPDKKETVLSPEEIEKKAAKELTNKANVFISALKNAKVKSRMLSSIELEMLCYRHFHPLTGNSLHYADYINDADFEPFMRSDEEDEIYNEAMEDMSAQLMVEASANLMDIEESGESLESFRAMVSENINGLSDDSFLDGPDARESVKEVENPKKGNAPSVAKKRNNKKPSKESIGIDSDSLTDLLSDGNKAGSNGYISFDDEANS